MEEHCIVKVAQYYKQFKKSGDPKEAKIQREDFLGIMQVTRLFCFQIFTKKKKIIRHRVGRK